VPDAALHRRGARQDSGDLSERRVMRLHPQAGRATAALAVRSLARWRLARDVASSMFAFAWRRFTIGR
jgi:hypothetical protein